MAESAWAGSNSKLQENIYLSALNRAQLTSAAKSTASFSGQTAEYHKAEWEFTSLSTTTDTFWNFQAQTIDFTFLQPILGDNFRLTRVDVTSVANTCLFLWLSSVTADGPVQVMPSIDEIPPNVCKFGTMTPADSPNLRFLTPPTACSQQIYLDRLISGPENTAMKFVEMEEGLPVFEPFAPGTPLITYAFTENANVWAGPPSGWYGGISFTFTKLKDE